MAGRSGKRERARVELVMSGRVGLSGRAVLQQQMENTFL